MYADSRLSTLVIMIYVIDFKTRKRSLTIPGYRCMSTALFSLFTCRSLFFLMFRPELRDPDMLMIRNLFCAQRHPDLSDTYYQVRQVYVFIKSQQPWGCR
jgi:hypothetical protein